MIDLEPAEHAIFRLGEGLLLVFKPAGHREALHSHPYAQGLRVLRGRIEVQVQTGERTPSAGEARLLSPRDAPLHLPAGMPHETVALEPTWLVAERV